MEITYLEDFNERKHRLPNWLQAEHHPHPDFIGILRYAGDPMVGGLWIRWPKVWVALERKEKEVEHDEKVLGRILQTFVWDQRKDGLYCGKRKFDYKLDPKSITLAEVRQLLLESAELLEECP